MGTVTVTIVNPDPDAYEYEGRNLQVYGTITLSGSYSTGGDTFTTGQFRMERLLYLDINMPGGGAGHTTAYLLAPNLPTTTGLSAAGTIQVFGSGASSGAALVEVTNGTNLSAFSFGFMAIGW